MLACVVREGSVLSKRPTGPPRVGIVAPLPGCYCFLVPGARGRGQPAPSAAASTPQRHAHPISVVLAGEERSLDAAHFQLDLGDGSENVLRPRAVARGVARVAR